VLVFIPLSSDSVGYLNSCTRQSCDCLRNVKLEAAFSIALSDRVQSVLLLHTSRMNAHNVLCDFQMVTNRKDNTFSVWAISECGPFLTHLLNDTFQSLHENFELAEAH